MSSYTVWAMSRTTRKEYDKYTGTDLDAAEAAYNKAQASKKWGAVYVEVDNRPEHYTPQQLRSASPQPLAPQSWLQSIGVPQ